MAAQKNITYTNTVDLAAGGTGASHGNLTMGSITFGGNVAAPLANLKAGIVSSSWTGTPVDWSVRGNTSTSNVMSVSGQLDLKGESADIMINGVSLKATLETLQERLNWMRPATEIEAEWDELRELGDRYRELEKQCREKSQMWKKLKTVTKTEQA